MAIVCLRIDSGIWYKRVPQIEASTKTEQTWDQHGPQMGPIWPEGGGKGQPKINKNMKKKKKRKRK